MQVYRTVENLIEELCRQEERVRQEKHTTRADRERARGFTEGIAWARMFVEDYARTREDGAVVTGGPDSGGVAQGKRCPISLGAHPLVCTQTEIR